MSSTTYSSYLALPRPVVGGLIAGTSIILIWSGWLVVSRWGVQQDLTPADITLLRFCIASFVTLPLLIVYLYQKKINLPWHRILVISLCCGFPYTLLCFYGLSSASVANAGILVNGLLPLASQLVSFVWLKQIPKGHQVQGIGLIFIAVCIMIFAKSQGVYFSLHWFLLISAAVVLSIYMVAVKHWEVPLLVILSVLPTVNFVLFLPLWLLLPHNLFNASMPEILLQGFYQGLLVSVVALWLFSYCVRSLGPTSSGVIMSLVPFSAAIASFFILAEGLTAHEWLGIGLCTLGLLRYCLKPKSAGNQFAGQQTSSGET